MSFSFASSTGAQSPRWLLTALCLFLFGADIDRASAGEAIYSTPGTYSFVVPASMGTLTVEAWGAGGGGGEDNGGAGANGTASSFGTVRAEGGAGGLADATGGRGGTAAGGSVNITGSNGETATKKYGGAGGAGANGGAGGTRVTAVSAGKPGAAAGGGGSGSYGTGGSNRAGGGGGGGYASRTFTPQDLPRGSTVNVAVGQGGAGGSGQTQYRGGDGAPGRVKVTWTEVAPPATNPSPPTGSVNVPATLTLSWTGDASVTSYALYFGTDPTLDPSTHKATQATTSFNISGLSAYTTYYWRVDSSNNNGTTAGTVWTFTTAPDLSFCADTRAMSFGTLCAVQPSTIDSRTKDVYDPAGTFPDRRLGFGYHVIAVPKNWSGAVGTWVHFTGSFGRPYDPVSAEFATAVWLNELMEHGYAVIQLAYDNRYSINGDLCGNDDPGYNYDNCAGAAREENLTGADVFPHRQTDVYNSIDYRLQSLITYLHDIHEIALPGVTSPYAVDWLELKISGHSQGAGQAYYIAKQRAVGFGCMLAGVYDSPDSVNPGQPTIADWFKTGTSITPVTRLGAFIATADESYAEFSYGLQLIGVTPVETTQATFVDENGASINGHAGTLKDPSLKPERAAACQLSPPGE